MVLQEPGEPLSTAVDVVAEIERRLAGEGLTPGQLARRLAAASRLHDALWDDPRLPAQIPARRAMLCSVAKLTERAAELDQGRSRACGHVPAEAAPSRLAAIDKASGTTGAAGRRRPRWSAHHTGWLLVAGLLLLALAAFLSPLGPGLLH